MGKKGLVTSIFSKLVDASPSSSPNGGGVQTSPPSWPWPSCRNDPQTASFRAGDEPCCTSRTTARGAVAAAGAAAAATTMTPARLQLRGAAAGEMYKTVNSVYFDSAVDDYFSLDGGEGKEEEQGEEVPDDDESCFSTTTASEEWSEAVIRSLARSTSTHRFFFDPGPPSINSTLPAPAAGSPPATITTTPPADEPPPKKQAAAAEPDDPDLVDDGGEKQQQQHPWAPMKSSSSLAEGSVAVAVDSSDPFADFRASMEEMVAAHGLRDWAVLEELLSWYLRVNGKQHHPLIVGAFVDMLIGLASSTAATSTTTTTTTSTSRSSGKSTKSSTTCTCSATSITAMKRSHRGANEASCSSSSSCAAPDEGDEKASDPSTSDDDHIQRHECEQHRCRST